MASKIQSKTKGLPVKKDNYDDHDDKLEKALDTKQIEKEQIENQQELYRNVLLEDYIYLKPSDLNNKIDDIILQKLKRKVEGKCIKVGYVVPDSIKILTRSLGIINNTNFDGITMYKVRYNVDVCNPAIGQIIQCTVFNIDKSQVICYVNNPETSPLEVFLFKHHHTGNTEFAGLKIGDMVSVRVGGSKWEYHDKQIITISQFVGKV
jgi:DNA-directed RNA polymerase subunit E'/Rpb7